MIGKALLYQDQANNYSTMLQYVVKVWEILEQLNKP